MELGGKTEIVFYRHDIILKYFSYFCAMFVDILNVLLYKIFFNLSKKLENVIEDPV